MIYLRIRIQALLVILLLSLSASASTKTFHVQYEIDTNEDLLEEGVKGVLELIKDHLPFLDKVDKSTIIGTNINRLTIATSNKSFKCNYLVTNGSSMLSSTSDNDITNSVSNFGLNSTVEVSSDCASSGTDDIPSVSVGTDTKLFQQEGNDNPNYESDYVIVRVYGKNSDLLTDRKHELDMIKVYSDIGVGPLLYATFNNGYISQYVSGRILEVSEFQDEYFYSRIATKLAQVHKSTQFLNIEKELQNIPATQKNKGGVWKLLYRWLKVTDDLYEAADLEQIKSEVKVIEEALKVHAENLCLTHNDVNHGNVIYNPDTGSLTFVDFEASEYSDRGFDIGNHFCEWSGLNLDFNKFPSVEKQRDFLRYYLSEYQSIPLNEVSELDIENLRHEANKYTLLSHLLWYVWSRIQLKISDIAYFDYEGYGRKRMDEYNKRKQEFLNL